MPKFYINDDPYHVTASTREQAVAAHLRAAGYAARASSEGTLHVYVDPRVLDVTGGVANVYSPRRQPQQVTLGLFPKAWRAEAKGAGMPVRSTKKANASPRRRRSSATSPRSDTAEYKFYVVDAVPPFGPEHAIVYGGFDFRDDAEDARHDLPIPAYALKVLTAAGVKRKYGAIRW